MSLSVRHRRMLLRLSHIIRGTISLENGIVKRANFHFSTLYPQCGHSGGAKSQSSRSRPPHSGQRQYFQVPMRNARQPARTTSPAMIFAPRFSIAGPITVTKRQAAHNNVAFFLQSNGVILIYLLYLCICICAYQIALCGIGYTENSILSPEICHRVSSENKLRNNHRQCDFLFCP